MKNSEKIIGKGLGILHFESHTAEAEIENPSTACGRLTENSVGVGARHGDAFGSALHCVAGARLEVW